MAKQPQDGRDTMANGPSKEAVITKGRIHTEVEGFFGNITTSAPFSPTYGNHKELGSEMAPMVKGGRSASEKFRKSLMAPRGTKES